MIKSRNFTPRLLPAASAAFYLGISETTLRSLPVPRRRLGGKRLYDLFDLDAYASDLPTEEMGNSCDQLFGPTD